MTGVPDFTEDEILPASWQDYAAAKGVPEPQIFLSWRKFKELSSYPFQYRRWCGWVNRERITARVK